MPNQVIVTLEQVTIEWLTAVLQRSQVLEQGAVASFAMTGQTRELSANAKLHLHYTADATGHLPQHLFLKIVNTNLDDEFFGRSEVDYYTCDYRDLANAPIPRCYDAAYSAELECYHILMDDIAQSHVEAATKTPTLAYGLALAEAMATLHAHWWGGERLAAGCKSIDSAQQIWRFVNVAKPGVEHILPYCQDDLKPAWQQTLRQLFDWHPHAMIARTLDDNGFTLIHGDANGGNIFVPKHGDRPIYLVDRQPFDWSLTVWLGVYDLAYAIIPRWDVTIRRQCEEPILRHYHACLLANGVQNYSWAQLWDDYRLSAAINLYVALEWCRGAYHEETRRYWLPMLKRSLTAFDDLECAKLQRE